jgi:tetratricopeptide (TPR) repeat protein
MKSSSLTKNEFKFGLQKLEHQGGIDMFKQIFATMNDVLDQIMEEYPKASSHKKLELDQELNVLKEMSDAFIEEWLLFEEKMGKHTEKYQAALPKEELVDPLQSKIKVNHTTAEEVLEKPKMIHSMAFEKAQGYFNLYMFKEAIIEFEKLVKTHPDFILARLYLALGYLIIGQLSEAARHFQFIIPVADQEKVKAIAFNAMGCIQYKLGHSEKASEYFEKAYESDPSLSEPIHNLEVLKNNNGSLELGLGLV